MEKRQNEGSVCCKFFMTGWMIQRWLNLIKVKVVSTSGLWVGGLKTWVILSGMVAVQKKRLAPFVLGAMENGDLWGVLKIAAMQLWMLKKRK